jgi:hypothetical protein
MAWLIGWQYRRPITINNSSNSSSLSDYQVLVTLDTQSLISAGKMRSDGGDIRFTDSDGVTLLNYWVESGINTSSTKIWVKVPSIPANSTKTIYVYYGNSSATDQSNGNNTFLFFDDFTSLSGWTVLNGGGTGTATVTTYGGATVAQLYSPNCSNRVAIVKSFSSSNSGMMIETRVVGENVADGIIVGFTDGQASGLPGQDEPNNGYVSAFARGANTTNVISRFVSRTQTFLASESYSATANTWYLVGLSWFGSSLNFFVNRALRLTGSDSTFSSRTYLHLSTSCGGKWDFDWVFVRKYTSPEPTISVGAEEFLGSRRRLLLLTY